MIIAVWGRDGIGKSMLCDALGSLFSKQGITAIVDTDLTQPTLPVRVNGKHFGVDSSLGKAISGIGMGDVSRYLHQHSKQKSLFYAGLSDEDEYLSYELGLEADNMSQDFTEQCAGIADTVILDLSGQRTDPFVPGALVHAHKIIVIFTPDVQGVCWFNAIKPLLENMGVMKRILPVAAIRSKQHDIPAVEKAIDLQLSAVLGFVKEFRMANDGVSPLDGTTPAAMRYARQVKKLYDLLKGGR